MSFAVSRADLAAAFGADRVVTVPPDRLNPLVEHPETVRFLTTVGLPDVPDFLFAADNGLAGGPATAVEGRPWLADLPGTADGVASWVLLGYFWSDLILLDGTTGRVRVLSDGRGEVLPLNSTVDLFARFLTAVQHDLPAMTEGDSDEEDELHEAAGERLLAELRTLDPESVGSSPDGYWPGVINEIVWG